MNLQEDIDRIKEVMGINEGFLNTFLRRRIPAFLDAVVDVADVEDVLKGPVRTPTAAVNLLRKR